MVNRFCLLMIIALCLAACTPTDSASATPTLFHLQPAVTVDFPNTAIPPLPQPTNTLVMANAWTPTPIPSATPLPAQTVALVTKIISPETIEVVLKGDSLNKTYTIKLLGVDAPANSPAEPWGVVAFSTLDRRLTGQVVKLVQDVTIQAPTGELPRYVYLGDTLINQQLIEQGLARAQFSSPDVSMQTKFTAAAKTAETAKLGLWGPDPTATATIVPTAPITMTVTPTITATGVITHRN